MPSDLTRKLGVAYFFLQGVLCLAWWAVMFVQPAWQAMFLPRSFGREYVFALSITDASLVGALSLVVAGVWACNHRWSAAAAWLLAGATAYATLLAVGSLVRTGEAAFGAAVMAPVLIITLTFAVMGPAPDRGSES